MTRTRSDNEEGERGEEAGIEEEYSQSDDENSKEEIEEEEEDGSIIMDDYDEDDRDMSIEEDAQMEEENELEENEDRESRDVSVEDDTKSVQSETEEEYDDVGNNTNKLKSEELDEDDDSKSLESEEIENMSVENDSRSEESVEARKENDEKMEDEVENDSEKEDVDNKHDDKETVNEIKEEQGGKRENSTEDVDSQSSLKDEESDVKNSLESKVSPIIKRSTRSQSVNAELKVDNKIGIFDSKTNEIKPDPESCAGLFVTKSELAQIRLKKDLIESRINIIEKFLDPEIKCKEWRDGEDQEEAKVHEIHTQRRRKQRRLTETEVLQRIAGKRKHSEETEAPVPVKKDGRGRPKGYKVKKEVVDVPEYGTVDIKPLVKRRKKDEMLLMKALDEEMLKMDEESNKELERISQGLDYQCSVCSQVFIEKKNLSKHFFKCLMKFTQSGRSSFKCAICFEYFSLLEALETHVARKHNGICDEPYQCSQCSLCFEQGSSLKSHVLKMHDVFQCVHCEKYYRNQHTLDVHVNKKHPGESSGAPPSHKAVTTNTHNVQVDDVQVKLEPIDIQASTEVVKLKADPIVTQSSTGVVRVKKLGRPFKRKPSEDTQEQVVVKAVPVDSATSGVEGCTKDVQVKLEPIDTQASTAVVKLKADPIVNQSSTGVVRVKKLGRPFNRKPSEVVFKTRPVDSATSGGDGNELGRGRRVKKKKALDYEDSIATTPGRRARKSKEMTDHTQTVNNIEQEIDRIRNELDDISRGHGFKEEYKTIPQPRVLSQPRILPQPRPQPRLLHQPEPKPMWKDSPAFQKNDDKLEKCSQGTNTPGTDIPGSVSKVTDKVIGNGVHTSGSSETQPIEQTVDTSLYLNRKVHLCPKCRKPFTNKYLVKLHMKRRHNIFKRKTVISPQAGDNASSGAARSNQARSKPPSGNRETLFKCKFCEASFPTYYWLEDHYLGNHDGIPCNVCKISIKNRMLLEKHMKACHAPADRYVCPVCDKRMKSKETLRKHIVMHEDRRPYDCAVCKRSFRYSYDMRLHMRRTHPSEWKTMAEAGEVETQGEGRL